MHVFFISMSSNHKFSHWPSYLLQYVCIIYLYVCSISNGKKYNGVDYQVASKLPKTNSLCRVWTIRSSACCCCWLFKSQFYQKSSCSCDNSLSSNDKAPAALISISTNSEISDLVEYELLPKLEDMVWEVTFSLEGGGSR